MSIARLVEVALNKSNFLTVRGFLDFCARYLELMGDDRNYQAEIISQNERNYRFYQYREDGNFSITRPINSDLMYDAAGFEAAVPVFREVMETIRSGVRPDHAYRHVVPRVVYTAQQSIGATLDALPAGASNKARKLNGDLFEHFIRTLIEDLGVDCTSGTIKVPVKDEAGNVLFKSSYQHDLMIRSAGKLKVIGSVKTSSKDRIDKIFMDKFLYSRLTETDVPHIAIFLNDVQRKNARRENTYAVNGTFLPGHFKAYTVKLNPLDGVYYCDIRPNMRDDAFLASHISTIDRFFFDDLGRLLAAGGQDLDELVIKEGDDGGEDENKEGS